MRHFTRLENSARPAFPINVDARSGIGHWTDMHHKFRARTAIRESDEWQLGRPSYERIAKRRFLRSQGDNPPANRNLLRAEQGYLINDPLQSQQDIQQHPSRMLNGGTMRAVFRDFQRHVNLGRLLESQQLATQIPLVAVGNALHESFLRKSSSPGTSEM